MAVSTGWSRQKGGRALMGFHSFSLDPRTVLGIGPEATLEEIHDAYRAKSKKHHPDLGGDEWAFRMVSRAYEVLKTTAESRPDNREAAGAGSEGRPTGPWAWTAGPWSAGTGGSAGAGAGPGAGAGASAGAGTGSAEAASEGTAAAASAAASAAAEPDAAPALDPSRIREVDVELIWTRFEKDRPARLLAESDADDSTLSVCMVISWPEAGLVDSVAGYPGAAETLRALIELFDRLREQKTVAARSRIEDGRFVGWLSYPDVLTAQDAILVVREAFRTHGLTIKLQTRDERIPFDWHAEANAPVMSQAS